MAYTPSTELPQLSFFQWSRPTAANPRLSSPIDEDDTTITFTSAPLDYLGAVITGNFLMGVKNSESYTELIYVPAGTMSVDGLTATGVVRGIRISGLDYTTGDSDFAAVHEQDSPVFCAVNAVYEAILAGVMAGTVATGAKDFVIGTEPGAGGETMTLYRTTTAGVKVGVFRWYVTSGKAQYSNDGTTWVNCEDVTASDLVKVSAADTTAAYLSDKLVSATGGIDFNIIGGGANETLNLTVDLTEVDVVPGPLANICSDVTATMDEINQALDGISVNVTDTNLNTLTAGPTSDATALHTHTSTNQTQTGIAYESITIGQSICSRPVEVQWYTQLTGVNTALGDSNVRRAYAMKFIPTKDVTLLNRIYFRAAEAVNASTALGDLVITIQTDNAGVPSGSVVTNSTATITQVTQRTWNTTQATRTATLAGNVTLTKGTTYHVVFTVSATDGVNYLNIGNASSYDENYLTFTRNTYNLDTTSWGSAVTNAPLFFWFGISGSAVTGACGSALVPTDADFGGRTWNFVGFADGAYSALETVTYYYEIVPITDLTLSLATDLDYYIATAVGTVSATIPNGEYGQDFAYKIGHTELDGNGKVILRVDRGIKKIFINEGTALTGTTVRQYILWFKPKLVKVTGMPDDANNAGISTGYFDGTNNRCIYGSSASTPASVNGYVSSASLYMALAGSANSFTGVGSDVTDIGFTYTFTETNAMNLMAMLECEA